MAEQGIGEQVDFAAVYTQERARLVRLCEHLTGDVSSAEDLAQETLYEAWRHRAALRDQMRHAQWLSGIARNVCLRWRRARGRSHTQYAPDDAGTSEAVANEAAPVDLEVGLERAELATLLDRALALLLPLTR